MYKGHMDKAKGGRFEGGRWGWVGWEVCGGVKMETIVLEQQLKKRKKKNFIIQFIFLSIIFNTI